MENNSREEALTTKTRTMCVSIGCLWHLLFFALAAMDNLLIYLHDVVNAFMEGTPPKDRLWARIDEAMSEYLQEKLNKTVPVGSFIQLKKMKQGHPEAGNQFDKVVKERYTTPLKAKPSVVEPCIMIQVCPTDNTKGLTLRQVDDFAIAAPTMTHHKHIADHLDNNFF